eukprot:239043-Alexandrium_andersonii.AAC.1
MCIRDSLVLKHSRIDPSLRIMDVRFFQTCKRWGAMGPESACVIGSPRKCPRACAYCGVHDHPVWGCALRESR